MVKESCGGTNGEVGLVVAAASVDRVASIFSGTSSSVVEAVCCWGYRNGALSSRRGSNVVGTIGCDNGCGYVKGWGLERDAVVVQVSYRVGVVKGGLLRFPKLGGRITV